MTWPVNASDRRAVGWKWNGPKTPPSCPCWCCCPCSSILTKASSTVDVPRTSLKGFPPKPSESKGMSNSRWCPSLVAALVTCTTRSVEHDAAGTTQTSHGTLYKLRGVDRTKQDGTLCGTSCFSVRKRMYTVTGYSASR